MNTMMFSGRRLATTLLAFATFVVMAAITPSGALAQGVACGPCAGSSKYRIEVASTWPAGLGSVSAAVNVEDRGTGATTIYTHGPMTAGSLFNQTFNVVNPTHQYDLSSVTLTYCGNKIIFQLQCYNPDAGNPMPPTPATQVVYCAPITCNDTPYCIQVIYQKGTGSDPYCWKITIDAVAGACPGNCTEL